jgi:hypothetical protein
MAPKGKQVCGLKKEKNWLAKRGDYRLWSNSISSANTSAIQGDGLRNSR